ncbi:MAG TPA: TraB/GumN family protein [Candidatus Binatia bacterium]|nr:TraB/GumN family protein [Candidatus Binatia bacterium]
MLNPISAIHRREGLSDARRLIFALLTFIVWSATSRTLPAQEKSLLWRVSRDDKSVHLLGSIHYLRKENYPLNPAILSTLDASTRLILEIDLNSTPADSAQRLSLEKAIYRDGTTLAQNVSDETYHLAERRASELGLDMRILNPMKPWFAALTMVAIKLRRMGLDPKFGVDRHLAERAKSTGKPTGGLETLEFQLGIFDRLSKREQELMLRETVSELERLDRDIDAIVNAWLKGEGDQLSSLLNAGMQEYPELYEKILIERNRRWVGGIEQLIQQESGAMVVVGAAHLVGKDSVVEMLKAKGYSVEQR